MVDRWLIDERITQADITLTCVFTFLTDAADVDAMRYPAISQHVARCEALPVFQEIRLPFFTPNKS